MIHERGIIEKISIKASFIGLITSLSYIFIQLALYVNSQWYLVEKGILMIIDWKCYFLWSVVIFWSNPSYLYQFSDNLWCNIARATVRQSLPGVSWPCLSIRVNTCVWSHRCDQVICNTCHFSAPLLLPVPRSYRCWAFRSESGAYDEDQIQTSLKKKREGGPVTDHCMNSEELEWSYNDHEFPPLPWVWVSPTGRLISC